MFRRSQFPASYNSKVPIIAPARLADSHLALHVLFDGICGIGTMTSELSDDTQDSLRSQTVCALCRQRKTKCDRQLPKCSFCVKAKVACQYLPRQRKRGLRAGYVSELESRIGEVF